MTHKEQAILVGVDNSSSLIANADSLYYSTSFVNELNNLKAEFEEDFQVEIYAFGEKVERNQFLILKTEKQIYQIILMRFRIYIPIVMW